MKPEISNSVGAKVRYLNDVEAAKIADLSPQTLRNWRLQGRGPAYVKLGRAVRYSLNDLISWLEGRRVNPYREGE
jgi:hypothetical protein